MTTHTHTAAVLYGAHDMRMETRTTAPPAPDEVLIRIRATSLCGTNMNHYHSGKNGMFVVQQPLILGHETAGEVVAIGSNVQQLQRGDRVVIEPQQPCKKSSICMTGRYNICPQMKFTGAGAIGLLCANLAKAAGAPRIGIVDIERSRLDFALGENGTGNAVATEEGSIIWRLNLLHHTK